MDVTFWGVRGSIPSPLPPDELEAKVADLLVGAGGRSFPTTREAVTYLRSLSPLQRGTAGGNTSCLSVRNDADLLILDAGSGLRGLGRDLMKGDLGRGRGEAHLLVSHTHWDHILGFPFFNPAYLPGNSIHIYGCHDHLEQRFRNQHDPRNFPVPFEDLGATVTFHRLTPGKDARIAGFDVRPMKLEHPGDAYAYRIRRDGRSLVYATDGAYNDLSPEAMTSYLDFYRNADILVFDAFFDFIGAFEKNTWGHSSSLLGVDIAVKAGVRRLLLFHHDHQSEDARLQEMLDDTHRYFAHVGQGSACEILLAYEGLTLRL